METLSIILVILQAFFIKQATLQRSSSGCYIDISNNTDGSHLPVFIDSTSRALEMVLPRKGAIRLRRGERIVLACPGVRNQLEDFNDKENEAICEGRNEFKIGTQYLDFEDVRCSKVVHASVTNVHSRCGGKGNTLLIGYSLDQTEEILPLIHVCYDVKEGKTLFTQHMLYGNELKYAGKSNGRPSFGTEGLPPNVIASTAYTKTFQKSRFSSLLGSSSVAGKYIDDSSFLATGHLSPFADFVYVNSRRSSNFYINACPQWQAINNGNWRSVEMGVRRTAESYNSTFSIITGTYDILKLPNSENVLVEITLQNGKLPVPKYIWKVMYDNANRRGIAFVVLNNPFANVRDKPEFCRNVCNIYGWDRSQWNDFSKGYVFCCEVGELQKVVGTFPFMSVRGVLQAVS